MDPVDRLPRHVGRPRRRPPQQRGSSAEGELATLREFLADYRLALRMKCEGLDPEQLARRSVPPSTMSLPKLYGVRDGDFDGAVGEQAAVDGAYADLEREQEAADAALARHPDLGERLGKDRIAVRELMVHRIEEYARHCGHADLLRECVDGRVGQ